MNHCRSRFASVIWAQNKASILWAPESRSTLTCIQFFLFGSKVFRLVTVVLLNLLSCSSDVLALPIFKQEESSLPSENENKILPFQYVLCTATSPAVKLHEETLTYLNQGDVQGLYIFCACSPDLAMEQYDGVLCIFHLT